MLVAASASETGHVCYSLYSHIPATPTTLTAAPFHTHTLSVGTQAPTWAAADGGERVCEYAHSHTKGFTGINIKIFIKTKNKIASIVTVLSGILKCMRPFLHLNIGTG